MYSRKLKTRLCTMLWMAPPVLAMAMGTPAYAQSASASRPDDAVTQDATIAALRSAALADTSAYAFVEQLTTLVGPRQAGTEAEARARRFVQNYIRAQGIANVRIEPFMMPTWVRGIEQADITAPYPMRVAVTALGNSGATPPEGIEGPVVVFADLAAFDAAPDTAIAGQIVYIGHAMHATQDGSSYGAFGPVRFNGPDRAARRGARAIVIRSVGTDNHRGPHTGNTIRRGRHADPCGCTVER